MIKRKTTKKLVAIVIFTIIFIVLLTSCNTAYEPHYFEKFGIDRYGRAYLYSDMIRDFGEPNEVITDMDGWTEAVYDDFIMSFWRNSPNSSLTNIQIISDTYRLGRRSIGLGSTKKEVEQVYKNVRKSPDPGWNYLDDNIYVTFFFDENDIVNRIQFFDYNHF